MYPIDLSGQKGVIFGVANDRSIAWSIAHLLGQSGAQLALTYQNERLKSRVERLAATWTALSLSPATPRRMKQ